MWGAAKKLKPMQNAGSSGHTINDILDAYLKEKRNEFADRVCLTADSIEGHLKAIRALWGAMTVEEFAKGTPADPRKSRQRVREQVQAWRRGSETQRPWQPNTCRTRLSKLRTALNYAVNIEMIEEAPKFDLPAAGPSRERFVHPVTELPALLEKADADNTPYHIWLMTELLIRLGCRKGVLLKLEFDKHIDFENRIVKLRETQTAEERKQNKKRRENQPMDQELYEMLLEARERSKSGFVIEFRGRPVKSTYGGQKALFRRAGIGDVTPHDLRRTSATFVYNELRGNLDAAAAHIADTKAMAEKTYVQKSVDVKLPGIEAIGKLIAKARLTPRH